VHWSSPKYHGGVEKVAPFAENDHASSWDKTGAPLLHPKEQALGLLPSQALHLTFLSMAVQYFLRHTSNPATKQEKKNFQLLFIQEISVYFNFKLLLIQQPSELLQRCMCLDVYFSTSSVIPNAQMTTSDHLLHGQSLIEVNQMRQRGGCGLGWRRQNWKRWSKFLKTKVTIHDSSFPVTHFENIMM
jgi:hypothetical protein